MCDQKACSRSMRWETRHSVGHQPKGWTLRPGESANAWMRENLYWRPEEPSSWQNGKRGSWTYWHIKTKRWLVKQSRWFLFLLKDFRISMFESISEELWKSMEFLGLQGRRGGPRKMELSQVSYQGVQIKTQEQGPGLQAWWGLNRRKAQQQGNGRFSLLGYAMNCSLKFPSANRSGMWTRGECFLLWCSRPSKTMASVLFLDYDSQHRVPFLSQTSNIYIRMKWSDIPWDSAYAYCASYMLTFSTLICFMWAKVLAPLMKLISQSLKGSWLNAWKNHSSELHHGSTSRMPRSHHWLLWATISNMDVACKFFSKVKR